jgi:hypothetical protein
LNTKAMKRTKLWAFLTFRWPHYTVFMFFVMMALGVSFMIAFELGSFITPSSWWWIAFATSLYFLIYIYANFLRGGREEEK